MTFNELISEISAAHGVRTTLGDRILESLKRAHELRVSQLIEANNTLVEKNRALARALEEASTKLRCAENDLARERGGV